jgi:hypothetical protein
MQEARNAIIDEAPVEIPPTAESRTPRGTVDNVLDILSKAIRDVVEK